VDDIYSYVTDQMIEETVAALQRRWEQDGGWSWASHQVNADLAAA
jgi:hypothetical protein